MSSKQKSPLSPLLLKVGLVIFVVGMIVMLALSLIPAIENRLVEALLGGGVLTLLCGPIIYFWIIHPLEQKLSKTMQTLRQEHDRVEMMTYIDPLTEIMNRRTFFDHFSREWERSQRELTPLSCILIDIDFFKQVNDTYGHVAGDVALKTIARLLRENIRSIDFLCRYGGEEFCILLPGTDEEGAEMMAERIRQVVFDTAMTHGEEIWRISASFGVAQRSVSMSECNRMVEVAEMALLASKQMGRNRVTRASSLYEQREENSCFQL